MTLFWKHVSFGGVCFISFAYSAPLLATAGIFSIDVAYMNYNLTLKVCKFSDKQSVLKIIYPYLLFLIMTANLVITIYMYLPVLKRAKILFRSRTVNDSKVVYETETYYTSCKSKIDDEKSTKSFKLRGTEITITGTNSRKNVRFETSDLSDEQPDASDVQSDGINRMTNNVADKTCDRSPKTNDKQ